VTTLSVLLQRPFGVISQRVLIVIEEGIAEGMFSVELGERLAPKQLSLCEWYRGRRRGSRWRGRRGRRAGRHGRRRRRRD
jgi:hypothetical protein